jgi:dTDP-L-rhamnose 4-epimerase
MKPRVLVTGGAGFIGSHLVDALIERGYRARVFDNLEPQVHGKGKKVPEYLNRNIEFIKADIREKKKLREALKNIDVIFHLAAALGVGQSMYEIERYISINCGGAANLLDILANEKYRVEKIIIASSMSLYGEGAYYCRNCEKEVSPDLRSRDQLARHKWELTCPACSQPLASIATREDKPLFPSSIYAISKRDQEEMFMNVGRAYNIPTVALRYFNIYGSRQALANPYTGVAAIFSARILNHNPPLIFEDGLQSRDFVHVNDAVEASILALEKGEADYQIFNVGSGKQLTILEVANILGEKLGFAREPKILNKFREGDVRHCFADISKIRSSLGFAPEVEFEEGLADLVEWVKRQRAVDRVEIAAEELAARGLTR